MCAFNLSYFGVVVLSEGGHLHLQEHQFLLSGLQGDELLLTPELSSSQLAA